MTLSRKLRRRLSRLRFVQYNSAVVRGLLSLYYKEERVYTIPFGALRGERLRYDRQIEYHTMLGLRDAEIIQFLSLTLVRSGLLNTDCIVCDIGANIGLYTLWFSRFLASAGTVYAFEPAPYALGKLRDHVALNGATNVQVFDYAVSDRCGTAKFYLGLHHHSMSSLDVQWAREGCAHGGTVVVRTTTLDNFFFQAGHSLPHFIKIDIEGGGVWALKGCDACIERGRPLVLIESHSPSEDRAISDLLIRNKYRAFRVTRREWVNKLAETYPNPEGVWGTSLFLVPEEQYSRVAAIIAATWQGSRH